MSVVVAFAVVAILAGLGYYLFRRPRRARPYDPTRVGSELGMSVDDITELDAVGARLEEEFGAVPLHQILTRLANVQHRRVPVRAVRPGPVRGLARVCFADGTVVQVRGRHLGDLAHLAVVALRNSIRVAAYHRERANVVMDMEWDDGKVSVLAVGLDQPD